MWLSFRNNEYVHVPKNSVQWANEQTLTYLTKHTCALRSFAGKPGLVDLPPTFFLKLLQKESMGTNGTGQIPFPVTQSTLSKHTGLLVH